RFARRHDVHGLGDKLLADPRLAGDEDRRVARCDLLEAGKELAHLDALTDHAGKARRRCQLFFDGLAQRLKAHLALADLNNRLGIYVDVVDSQIPDKGSVGGIEVAQSIADLVEGDLKVQSGDARI